jgi:hypothetical protein
LCFSGALTQSYHQKEDNASKIEDEIPLASSFIAREEDSSIWE